jgi:hypothetical protein
MLDRKLYFRHHMDYIFSNCSKMQGLILRWRHFSTSDGLHLLYTPVRSVLGYEFDAWNSITRVDSSKQERVKRNSTALRCYASLGSYMTMIIKACYPGRIFYQLIPGGDILMPHSFLMPLKSKLMSLVFGDKCTNTYKDIITDHYIFMEYYRLSPSV